MKAIHIDTACMRKLSMETDEFKHWLAEQLLDISPVEQIPEEYEFVIIAVKKEEKNVEKVKNIWAGMTVLIGIAVMLGIIILVIAALINGSPAILQRAYEEVTANWIPLLGRYFAIIFISVLLGITD